MHGDRKRTVISPHKSIELQPPSRVIDRENGKTAVGFTAGAQWAAGVDGRDGAEAFSTLNMCVSMYGNCTAEAFGCHTKFPSVKFNMMQMPVRQ